ncbi:MAG TPA: GNAT family N-acetyltransferase [Puia sp.]|jgi:hypothetical protein|nr:GNAT family N-acetyltransferase [Puia sp.]
MDTIEVINNPEREQFQVNIDGETASLEYRFSDGVLVLMHTEVPEKSGGKGIASALAAYAFSYAREKGLRVKVYCPFVQAWLKRHPEVADLLTPGRD